ncbi:8-oxoguanine glycosylase ogg1 [Coemansia sp. RSA 487]|nr:8-oxoguanine glycosylase ogg1 [Coemansia sp. RSA 986]KAJ2212420.1 8-oxoguanine glycosylase ogg1 [Coemansia sp. RSA 487]
MVNSLIKKESEGIDIQVPWKDLEVSPSELRLNQTLMCGQAFRWKSTGENEWTCALWDTVVDLKQTSETVLYRSLGHRLAGYSEKPGGLADELHEYFRLDENLGLLCDRWASVDPDFDSLRQTQLGVRALKQPVVENMFTFIASSNNNIKRITMLIDKLCQQYGHPIDTAKGTFHTFPRVQDIAQDKDIEGSFTKMGFGYRAKYYAKTVERLSAEHEDPEQFLLGLRANTSWESVKAQLMQFSGVGPKVADCICLMSMDKIDAVPVDTHIWQIAKRRYVDRILALRSDSVLSSQAIQIADDKKDSVIGLARELSTAKLPTTKTYETAQKLFVDLFSPHAGWAQLLLFSGDLDSSNGIKKPAKKSAKPAKTENQPKRKASVKTVAPSNADRALDEAKCRVPMLRSRSKRSRAD